MRKGEVRNSQLITTYGVGAIVAVEDEAVMIAGIDRWRVDEINMHEPRLEQELRVDGFVIPPATEKGDDIPSVRFPDMHSCPECHTLGPHSLFTTYNQNMCNICGTSLVPSRFVVACSKGHIDDFPYARWIHEGSPRDGKQHDLRIESAGATASLADVQIMCSCGQSKTMAGSFGRSAMGGITTCRGKRPWLVAAPETCDEIPRTLQRGASNVWFPVVRSALSIPPWSEGAFQVLNRHWSVLRFLGPDALHGAIVGLRLPERSGFTAEELVEAVLLRKEREGSTSDEPIKPQEYEALMRGRSDDGTRADFVSERAPIDPSLDGSLDRVMVAKRLREARVLESFTRILPPSAADPPDRRAALFDAHTGWLPGIEVRGEGVFLKLGDDLLRDWEQLTPVRQRVARINRNYAERARALGSAAEREITPRLVVIHTLAHVMIAQWSLDSGYPAASLRERLYVDDAMAALLIYTATSDSAGSLGGVVAQARPDILAASVREALRRASWCSADPLCVEAEAAGVDSLNLAACHACVLLPEVSCEESNLLLDRALLVGTPDDSTIGIFAHLVA